MLNVYLVNLLLLLAASASPLLAVDADSIQPLAGSIPAVPIASSTTTLASQASQLKNTTETLPASAPQTTSNNVTEQQPAVEPVVTTTISPAPPTSAPEKLVAPTTSPSYVANNITGAANSTNATEATPAQQSQALLAGSKTIVDLTHPLNNGTLHWPVNYGFTYSNDTDGERLNERNETYYVKSDGFKMAVHTGTHLDAPRHFSKEGWTVDKIPLERLIDVPIQVIDLSKFVSVNRSYEFMRSDFLDPETGKSLIRPKSVLLVYTGISKFYAEGEKAYFGTDNKNISEMSIPGFSREAAKLIAESGVYGVGLDAPSADSSNHHSISGRYDPVAHGIFNSHNIYILENINNRLSELVNINNEATLTVAPLPIVGGSGSPVRLVAISMHSDCHSYSLPVNAGASNLSEIKFSATIAAIFASIYTIVTILMI